MARQSIKAAIDGIISAVMLVTSVGAILLIAQNRTAKISANQALGQLPSAPISLIGTAVEGDVAAPVALVVFMDFECPFCRSFGKSVLPIFREQYVDTGRILLSFRHVPLTTRQWARAGSQAAFCAHAQGQFWNVLNKFLSQPIDLDDIDRTMANLAADVPAFVACRSSKEASQVVESNLALAKTLRIQRTPAFLIGANDRGRAVKVTTRFTGITNYKALTHKLSALQDGPGR